MANEEHLKILKQGVTDWNLWRRDNPEIIPDLSEAYLLEKKLARVNFNQANLRMAVLHGSIFDGADLSVADLSKAVLTNTNFSYAVKKLSAKVASLYKANLEDAELSRANFEYANLDEASLLGSDLHRTNFTGTSLSKTNFGNARIAATRFENVDLSAAIGLERVRYEGPSTISIDTIYASNGKIPESFLRGAGVPENFITYMHSLAGKAFDYYSCFISYSHEDQDFTDRLYADLQNEGVRTWVATEDMKIGDEIVPTIDQAIRLRDKLLVVLSENSIESDWVANEVEMALEEEKRRGETVLFPIRLDDAVMDSKEPWAAMIRRRRHIGDFRNWKNHDDYQKAFERLLRDLKGKGGKEEE